MKTLWVLFRFFFALPAVLISATWHGRIWHAAFWGFTFTLFLAICLGYLDDV